MKMLFVYYVLLHIGLMVVSSWLLALNRPACWRVPLAFVWFGSVGNLVALLHLGYDRIWPTEALVATGVLAIFAGLVVFKRPLATRRS